MKQIQDLIKLNYQSALLLLAIIVTLVAASMFAVARRNHIKAAASSGQVVAISKSQLSFDANGVVGWHKGPSNETSLVLFKDDSSCFVSIARKSGILDEAAELQKTKASLTGDGYVVSSDNAQTSALQTATGKREYALHQFAVTGTGSAGKLYGGQEFGYVSLSSGDYLAIEGYCNTADQIAASTLALQSIQFTENN